jgi:hypothetical protein
MADTEKRDDDPTKAPEFQRVLRNMLSAPPKKHSEMKTGRKSRAERSDASAEHPTKK